MRQVWMGVALAMLLFLVWPRRMRQSAGSGRATA